MKQFYAILLFAALATTAWAQTDSSYYEVIHLGKNVNTTGAEYGGTIIDDSLFLYSSLQHMGEKHSWMVNFDNSTMQIYQSKVGKYGSLGKGSYSELGFNSGRYHNGNIAYDPLENTVYFTRCQGDDDDVSCNIYYSRRVKGKWQKAKKMGGDVNMKGYTSTQPAVGHLDDGRTILFFSSDRPNGVGGMDIWYSILNGDTPEPCVNLGTPVNTSSDEETPFYDDIDGWLYFSSNKTGGIGGYDIYRSQGSRNSWQTPETMPAPVNSKYNDLYFCTRTDNNQEGFLSSNREDSYFELDSSCCNDLYIWNIQHIEQVVENDEPELSTARIQDGKVARVAAPPAIRRAKDLLPINLYFHNDEPDPDSRKPVTSKTYFETYNTYMFMRHEYLEKQPPVSHGNIIQFFEDEVHGNCKNFETFLQFLANDIKSGRDVCITIAGYASTKLNSDYNFNLSKRRISSIINQIMTYNNGQIFPNKGPKNTGSLQIKEVPYGSSQSVSAVNGSIYSIAAASERRIEILDYTYTDEDTVNRSRLVLPTQVQNIGTFEGGKTTELEVRLPNSVKTEADLDFISAGNEDATITGHTKLIPGKDLVIYIHLDNRKHLKDETRYLPLSLRVAGESITQTIFLEYQISEPKI